MLEASSGKALDQNPWPQRVSGSPTGKTLTHTEPPTQWMVGQKREPLPVPAPHPSGTRPSTQHKEQTPWQTPAPETSDLGVQWGHSGDNKEMPTGTFGAEATEQPQPSPQSSSRGSQKSAPHTQAPWLAGASPRHKLSTLEAKESFALCARSSKPHGKSAGQRWGTGHLGAVIPVGAGRGGGGGLHLPQ